MHKYLRLPKFDIFGTEVLVSVIYMMTGNALISLFTDYKNDFLEGLVQVINFMPVFDYMMILDHHAFHSTDL